MLNLVAKADRRSGWRPKTAVMVEEGLEEMEVATVWEMKLVPRMPQRRGWEVIMYLFMSIKRCEEGDVMKVVVSE
jgi:hypothetical protein